MATIIRRRGLTEEDRAIGDLREEFIARDPRFQSRRRASPSEAAGAITLAWYRGKQAGVYDAYDVLKKKHPRAAAYLKRMYPEFAWEQ